MAYSLWLQPDHRQTRRLKSKIEQLSRQCGSDSFDAHLTISSGLPERPKTSTLRALASRHQKVKLAALRVQHSQKHYQCLTLALRRDRTLMALRADALSSLGGQRGHAPYQPHISLLYAKLSASRRAALAKQIPAELLSRCTGSKLQLVFTDGPARQWQLLEQHNLGAEQ